MQEFLTACPRNCYSSCSFRVQVEDNRIVKILPYTGNLATPEGPCIKGLSYIERHQSPDRILHPLLKNSKGEFTSISMNEALDIIAGRLSRIKSEYGPQSILWYKGSGMSGLTNEIGSAFWKAFGGTTTTYGNLCWPAGLEAVRLTMGSVKHNVPWDLENAKTILIWGKNPAETNIQEISFIANAKAKGCKVIVIDPVRTPTGDKADILFNPKPATDGALALAITKILIDRDLIDHDYISRYVKGYDEFRKSLQITAQEAAVITGIPPAKIVELAITIGTGGPLTILPGYGLQRHMNGGQTIRAILMLSVLTGNIGKAGAGFNYANLQSYIYDDVKEPVSYYPDELNDAPFRRTISMTKLGTDMLKEKNPELKAAWIERGNPVSQAPNTNKVREAFSGLSFIVVVEQFMTDTASMADIILPAKDIFEQSDIIGSYWNPYVQFKPKVVDSQGEVLPESEIYYHLAKKLSLNVSNELIPEPGNNNIETWLEKRIGGQCGITLNELRKAPVIPPGLQEIAWSDYKFDTASGKIEIYSAEAAEKWGASPLPLFTQIIRTSEEEKFPLTLLTPNTGSRIHSQFGNLKVIKQTTDKAVVRLSPVDAVARNISTGKHVRVFNNVGELHGIAEVTNRISTGLVVFPNGIWLSEGGGVNCLVEGRETDFGFGASFHDNRVDIEIAD
jgi:anaerobic selenocysteine-containing dehydrogenase